MNIKKYKSQRGKALNYQGFLFFYGKISVISITYHWLQIQTNFQMPEVLLLLTT